MPFTLDQYSGVRPFLYHLTARENLERIRSLKRLDSAAILLLAADEENHIRTRRRDPMPLLVERDQILVRDQAPLHPGNIEFQGGWDLEDLVAELNRRVFFWSGRERGPVRYGANHFRCYQRERPVIIRVRFDVLRRCNMKRVPLFCKYNSGSPRCYQGRGSPRGPDTFAPAERCSYNPGDVVEVTFLGSVSLPPEAEISSYVTGPWQPLFASS